MRKYQDYRPKIKHVCVKRLIEQCRKSFWHDGKSFIIPLSGPARYDLYQYSSFAYNPLQVCVNLPGLRSGDFNTSDESSRPTQMMRLELPDTVRYVTVTDELLLLDNESPQSEAQWRHNCCCCCCCCCDRWTTAVAPSFIQSASTVYCILSTVALCIVLQHSQYHCPASYCSSSSSYQ